MVISCQPRVGTSDSVLKRISLGNNDSSTSGVAAGFDFAPSSEIAFRQLLFLMTYQDGMPKREAKPHPRAPGDEARLFEVRQSRRSQ